MPDSRIAPPASEVKPLRTRYAGHEFRSRLEARWVVWFDTLGIPWQYELEGYEVAPNFWYLPDFFIPTWDAFVEIKPGPIQNPGLAKCACLCDLLDKQVIVVQGTPSIDKYTLKVFSPRPNSWCHTRECVFAEDRREERVLWISCREGCACLLDTLLVDHDRPPLPDTPRLLHAYEKASSARFGR